MQTVLTHLSDEPKLFPGCCSNLSKPLVETLSSSIPKNSLVFSVGAGSGLLERLMLEHGVNIRAVEVMSCANLFFPEERMVRVPTPTSLHPDAVEADVLLFCYPRSRDLVEKYLKAPGAMQQAIFISHRDEWHGERGYHNLLRTYFASVREITLSKGSLPVLAAYEALCVASSPVGR
ncbi:uncharacterized protein RCC_02838 [Ramularia collo-cygni]|uniref:Methyltransferase type 11 domain-containing protein n=1 Tax=Ramularia collo-cygni TaxID=112498 RepID=A0A2D3V0F7_9PEZI|nr:uncharacterized protein RCC_02838 [Ramularia collo-cygni]CZT17006.1 uncharacterized protein RCC_02838 [Ramularia collo-cygni]